jgi:hypothetical protein
LASGRSLGKYNAQDAVKQYLSTFLESIPLNGGYWINRRREPGVREVRVTQYGKQTDSIVCGDEFKIEVYLDINEECANMEIGFGIIDEEGRDVIRVNNKHLDQPIDWSLKKKYPVEITVPQLNWIYGEHIYIGIYFGYIGDHYQEFHAIIKLRLIKRFGGQSLDKIVAPVNTIYIGGIKFK